MPDFFTLDAILLEQLQHKAVLLAEVLRRGDVVTLRGELGAGKTTFARALIGALNKAATEVTSPTFNLMQSYDVQLANGSDETLWHLDLYRLQDKTELQELGLDEIWPHLTLIEWPEIAEHLLPAEHLDITFGIKDSIDARSLHFSGNEAWRSRLGTLR